MLLPSSINYKDDENDMKRKAKDLISKTKILNLLHTFFAVITWLVLSNLMGMLCECRFNLQDGRYDFDLGNKECQD